MKFAKELDEDLVPEWRVKYFDYKQAKKKIKAITRAIRNANRVPRTPKIRSSTTTQRTATQLGNASQQRLVHQSGSSSSNSSPNAQPAPPTLGNHGDHYATPPISIPAAALLENSQISVGGNEHRSLRPNGTVWTRYGSIIGSPPSRSDTGADALRLPEPALDTETGEPGITPAHSPEEGPRPPIKDKPRPHLINRHSSNYTEQQHHSSLSQPPNLSSAPTPSLNAFEIGKPKHTNNKRYAHLSLKHKHTFQPLRNHSVREKEGAQRPLLERMFYRVPSAQQTSSFVDVPLEALEEIDTKQEEFWGFMDKELDKIEKFYKEKEEEANHRLAQLRQQLHAMRDQRLEEIMVAETSKERKRSRAQGHKNEQDGEDHRDVMQDVYSVRDSVPNVAHSLDVMYHPIQTAKRVRFGNHHVPKGNVLATPPSAPQISHHLDYSRKHEIPEIPYHAAKQKLKTALQEFYRGLELLKSYVLLNRTALRKINKKYDKAVHARPTMRYMSERVNEAWFVKSTVLDGHITAVEDLYARYFEKGNHKIAVGKLRKKNANAGSYMGSVFRNGLFIAAGLVFGIEGIVYSVDSLYHPDGTLVIHTSYLLQLYGGYLLMLLLTLFFVVDARVFTENKINYAFVFEFDARHDLDWHQLAELPSFFMFLFGLVIWLNFTHTGGREMYIYWPVVLIGVTAVILFFPFPVLYHKSRKWFLYSLWRLLFAGLYPVEFRDFFLGDMFCSLTYAMGNIELFFCLYANHWSNPPMCNSSSSRLLGFFTALPAVWRLLQCARRYYDTRAAFPHLFNLAKYMLSVLAPMSLSMYRIDQTVQLRAVFIVFSLLNSVYCSIWDLLMDWSLFDASTSPPFLRKTLGYKRPSFYYFAMVMDPIFRFSWIFYAIFGHDYQHSASLSFFIALAEVFRRGIWSLLRVENEHCTNVGRFRASRDVPLPYPLPADEEAQHIADNEAVGGHTESMLDRQGRSRADTVSSATSASVYNRLTGVSSGAGSSLRRRVTAPGTPDKSHGTPSIRTRVGNLIHYAHAQDFERKRPASGAAGTADDEDEDDDEEDDTHGEVDTEVEDTEEAGDQHRRLNVQQVDVDEAQVRSQNESDLIDAQDLVRREGRRMSFSDRRGSRG